MERDLFCVEYDRDFGLVEFVQNTKPALTRDEFIHVRCILVDCPKRDGVEESLGLHAFFQIEQFPLVELLPLPIAYTDLEQRD